MEEAGQAMNATLALAESLGLKGTDLVRSCCSTAAAMRGGRRPRAAATRRRRLGLASRGRHGAAQAGMLAARLAARLMPRCALVPAAVCVRVLHRTAGSSCPAVPLQYVGTLFNLAKAEQQLGRQQASQALIERVLESAQGVSGERRSTSRGAAAEGLVAAGSAAAARRCGPGAAPAGRGSGAGRVAGQVRSGCRRSWEAPCMGRLPVSCTHSTAHAHAHHHARHHTCQASCVPLLSPQAPPTSRPGPRSRASRRPSWRRWRGAGSTCNARRRAVRAPTLPRTPAATPAVYSTPPQRGVMHAVPAAAPTAARLPPPGCRRLCFPWLPRSSCPRCCTTPLAPCPHSPPRSQWTSRGWGGASGGPGTRCRRAGPGWTGWGLWTGLGWGLASSTPASRPGAPVRLWACSWWEVVVEVVVVVVQEGSSPRLAPLPALPCCRAALRRAAAVPQHHRAAGYTACLSGALQAVRPRLAGAALGQ